jgi:hypothetical protein
MSERVSHDDPCSTDPAVRKNAVRRNCSGRCRVWVGGASLEVGGSRDGEGAGDLGLRPAWGDHRRNEITHSHDGDHLDHRSRNGGRAHSRTTCSGPFTPRAAIATSKAKAVIASNLSFGSRGSGCSSSKAHLPTSARFRSQAHGPVSGRLSRTTAWSSSHHVPVSRRLSATGIRFLGHPVPARELGSPHGRLTGTTGTTPDDLPDPDGFSMFRTRETRLGLGALFTPGTTVSTRPSLGSTAAACRLATAQSLPARHYHPTRTADLTRHRRGFPASRPMPSLSPATSMGPP